MAKVTNLERRIARMNAFPAEVQAAVEEGVKAEVDRLVAAMKRAAPVSELENQPGELRDSITAYPVEGRPASWRIIVKARDKKGRYYGRYVEFGHTSKDGSYVPAQPFFFPTYRAREKGRSARILRSARKLIRQMFPKPKP
jgi:HK97 gp10 family phage protein